LKFRSNPHFPWKLLRKILLKSTILFVAIVVLVFAVFRWIFLQDLKELFPQVEWVSFLNIMFFMILGSSFALFAGIVAFVFVEFLIPLGVLYARVKSIEAHSDNPEDMELSYDEPGEWSDLETSVAHIRDELRLSQKKSYQNRMTLYSLLSALPEGIVAIDVDQRPIFYNQSFLDIFNITSSVFENSRLVEVMRYPFVLDAFSICLSTHKPSRVEVKVEPQPGAESKIYSVSVFPLRDTPESKVYGAVSIFQDVTELKHLEQVRIDFVANVSHELRTPLTSVKGYAQALSQDLKEKRFDQGEKYIDIVTKNVDRLLHLVGDLLDLSSLESGVTIQKEEVDTTYITETVLEQLEPVRKEKQIHLKLNYSVHKIWADGARAQQVLVNLIQNAIQYIPTGGEIEVSWTQVSDGVELRVKDNGPGISPEHLRRIFERFYRVDRARTRESGGTGLGLAIVKHIMQRHGGSVRAESRVGQGVEFICLFPQPKRSLEQAL
jgi:two-component system phosphate regulon sensor histidine kinase PhoR